MVPPPRPMMRADKDGTQAVVGPMGYAVTQKSSYQFFARGGASPSS